MLLSTMPQVVRRSGFVGTLDVVNKILVLTFGHTREDESAKQRSSATHSNNRESRRARAKAISDNEGALQGTTPPSSTSASPGAINTFDYPG